MFSPKRKSWHTAQIRIKRPWQTGTQSKGTQPGSKTLSTGFQFFCCQRDSLYEQVAAFSLELNFFQVFWGPVTAGWMGDVGREALQHSSGHS